MRTIRKGLKCLRAIAIDGPAGAGKSTIARKTAEEIGFIYVDTGALYRAVALATLSAELTDKGKMTDRKPLSEQWIVGILSDTTIALKFIDGEQRVFLNGKDVSSEIRSPEVSTRASAVSSFEVVRKFLFALQQDIAENNDVIMDGRDIGTVILPNADIKIFLTATVDDRAKRRYDQLLESGTVVNFEELKEQIEQRDYDDSYREIAPLRQAADAILVDTSGYTLDESIELLRSIILGHFGKLK